MTERFTSSSSVPVRASREPQISAIKSLLSELADGRPLCDPTMDDPPCASCEAIFQKFYELAAAASPSDDGAAREPELDRECERLAMALETYAVESPVSQQHATDLKRAAKTLTAARARIVVLETSVDSLRYLIDHPVTQQNT